MKPYEPPPVATSNITRQNTPPPHDESLMNHGHGPTAFEKGYATGAQNSRLLKNQVQGFFIRLFCMFQEEARHLNSNQIAIQLQLWM